MCDDWHIPCVELLWLRRPEDGQSRLSVTGDERIILGYMNRFGFVPANYRNQKKLVRPDGTGGWDVLDPSACPKIARPAVPIIDDEKARLQVLACDWQLVGYTFTRTLVRLLFDPRGEGYWSFASWGFRDIAPNFTQGYFLYSIQEHQLAIEWENGTSASIPFRVFDELHVCIDSRGDLIFYDYSLEVGSHVVPSEVKELDGWPLSYWGNLREVNGNERI